MINETVTAVKSLTFDQVTLITKEPLIITGFVIVWLLPIIIYIIVGVTVKGRSASGVVSSEPMITNPNYFIPLIIWGLIQLALIMMFLVFPIQILIRNIFI